MSSVTVRESEVFFVSDITKTLYCSGPAGSNGPVVHWLTAGDAYIKPGSPVTRKTGAAGEASVTKCASNDPRVYGYADFDPNKLASCDVAYDENDTIPVIPIDQNLGTILRNIRMDDPGSNVDADTPLCSLDDSNDPKTTPAIEATLASEAGDAFNLAVNQVVGINGAAGSTIHSRIIGRTMYYLADPNADARMVIRLTRW